MSLRGIIAIVIVAVFAVVAVCWEEIKKFIDTAEDSDDSNYTE